MKSSADFGQGVTANVTFVAEGCDDLPVHRTDQALVTCWRLSLLERLQVLFGGRVFLWVRGDSHPPVMLETRLSAGGE